MIEHFYVPGSHPNVTKGTKTVLCVDPSKNENSIPNFANFDGWDAFVYKQSGNYLILRIHIASGAPVGVWNCQIVTSLKTSRIQEKVFQYDHPFYVLFNPYSEGK